MKRSKARSILGALALAGATVLPAVAARADGGTVVVVGGREGPRRYDGGLRSSYREGSHRDHHDGRYGYGYGGDRRWDDHHRDRGHRYRDHDYGHGGGYRRVRVWVPGYWDHGCWRPGYWRWQTRGRW